VEADWGQELLVQRARYPRRSGEKPRRNRVQEKFTKPVAFSSTQPDDVPLPT